MKKFGLIFISDEPVFFVMGTGDRRQFVEDIFSFHQKDSKEISLMFYKSWPYYILEKAKDFVKNNFV